MTQPAPSWSRLPLELRNCPQWVIAGQDKSPKALGSTGLYAASVQDPTQWHAFEVAAEAAYAAGLGIGFVLHKDDPYTCIDLDVKDSSNEPDPTKWTTQAKFDEYWRIVQRFDSYTETSRSGKGLHIWVRGRIGAGMKRGGYEVYSQERYIISTGNVVHDRPIADRQDLLDVLVRDMRGPNAEELDPLVELPELEEDRAIYERAVNAGNADKFNALWAGQWQAYGFPSQSEADLALMSIFTFYSKSNAQCRRLFRMSALGQRAKAVKDDRYINYTLRVIRSRQAREAIANFSGIEQAADFRIEEQRKKREAEELVRALNEQHAPTGSTALHVPGAADPVALPQPSAAACALAGPVGAGVAAAGDSGLPWPPGLAGAIAGFVYESAPRPVKEVAIIAALGLLAGICGKAYCIPQSGLNLYLILVARSAVGKEALHSGISAIVKAVYSRSPAIDNFVDFSDYASGPALVKTVAQKQSVINVAGEWGRKLKRMAQDDGRDGALGTLRTAMTNLYQKSGPASVVGGITYSNKDSSIASVSGVAFSMLGETTPSTFYESLTESMMEDGFLSRFTVIEYDGLRPPLNTNPLTEPSKALGDALGELVLHANFTIVHGNTISVHRTEEAAQVMWDFEQECDKQINGTTDESWRQMWNRASLKVMRISGLLAAADNYIHPIIQKAHVEWALDVIRRDIAIMRKRIESGDVGMGDHSRERKLTSIMSEYLTAELPEGYKIPKGMQENSIIPRKFLQTRVARVSAFTQHRLGASAGLNQAIQSLIDSGYIMDVDKTKMIEGYGFHGKCYRILNLPDHASERKH